MPAKKKVQAKKSAKPQPAPDQTQAPQETPTHTDTQQEQQQTVAQVLPQQTPKAAPEAKTHRRGIRGKKRASERRLHEYNAAQPKTGPPKQPMCSLQRCSGRSPAKRAPPAEPPSSDEPPPAEPATEQQQATPQPEPPTETITRIQRWRTKLASLRAAAQAVVNSPPAAAKTRTPPTTPPRAPPALPPASSHEDPYAAQRDLDPLNLARLPPTCPPKSPPVLPQVKPAATQASTQTDPRRRVAKARPRPLTIPLQQDHTELQPSPTSCLEDSMLAEALAAAAQQTSQPASSNALPKAVKSEHVPRQPARPPTPQELQRARLLAKAKLDAARPAVLQAARDIEAARSQQQAQAKQACTAHRPGGTTPGRTAAAGPTHQRARSETNQQQSQAQQPPPVKTERSQRAHEGRRAGTGYWAADATPAR